MEVWVDNKEVDENPNLANLILEVSEKIQHANDLLRHQMNQKWGRSLPNGGSCYKH